MVSIKNLKVGLPSDISFVEFVKIDSIRSVSMEDGAKGQAVLPRGCHVGHIHTLKRNKRKN
jgi:hypothetical protein